MSLAPLRNVKRCWSSVSQSQSEAIAANFRKRSSLAFAAVSAARAVVMSEVAPR